MELTSDMLPNAQQERTQAVVYGIDTRKHKKEGADLYQPVRLPVSLPSNLAP